MFSRIRWMIVLVFCSLLVVFPAYAQKPSGATLFPPDSSEFPLIRVFLDVHNLDGTFLHGLNAEDIRVLENAQPRSLSGFSELRPGAQVVFALNAGDSFTIRNSQGISRYDFIYEALANWAKERQGSTVDDLSLLVSSSPVHTHTSSPEEFIAALDTVQMDTAVTQVSLDSLSQALDVVSDMTPRDGMERAVFFITSPLEGDQSLALQNLTTRALQQRVHIYVWYIASPNMFDAPAAVQLQDLAQQTGGDLIVFSGEEGLPSPEKYLDSLRDIYLVEYETGIASGGAHELVVEIQTEDEQLTTPPLNFDVTLLPPDPAFISPVAEIIRQAPEGESGVLDQVGAEDLLPKEHPLQVLIDFPDGRVRPLQLTRLYVDGQMVAENAQPPFDQFVWDLSRYSTTAQHLLQVEAIDSLGFTGKSIEIPVEVQVKLPKANPLIYLVQNAPAILGLAIVLGIALALLILILSGRIRPHALRVPAGFRYARRKEKSEKTQAASPGGQVRLGNESDGHRLSGWVSRLHWPQRRLASQPYAYLVPISTSEEGQSVNPISIDSNEVTLGSDRNQAVLAIDDATVDGLHARLKRDTDGAFTLLDEGSIAGTWVNYASVAPEGVRLNHGDIINIGRAGFQFKLREAGSARKPVVIHQRSEA
jgi:FHA domain